MDQRADRLIGKFPYVLVSISVFHAFRNTQIFWKLVFPCYAVLGSYLFEGKAVVIER